MSGYREFSNQYEAGKMTAPTPGPRFTGNNLPPALPDRRVEAAARALPRPAVGMSPADLGAWHDHYAVHVAERVLAAADAVDAPALAEALALVDSQAEDEGLWFVAETVAEAYLQQELRELHAAVERARRFLTDQETT